MRRWDMLNLDTLTATVAPVPPFPGGAGRMTGAGLDQDEVSDGTQGQVDAATAWMIAVRDRRDRAAFARLFDHFAPRLKAAVMRSGTSSAEAEDIVQDVMLAVWRKAAHFDAGRAHVAGWIYAIARNRQIDLARRKARPVPEDLAVESVAPADSEGIITLDQEVAQLRRALARLKPEQKQLIEKAYLGEMSHVEIHDDTGLPLGTIKSRIRLGLDRLRHELKGLRRS